MRYKGLLFAAITIIFIASAAALDQPTSSTQTSVQPFASSSQVPHFGWPQLKPDSEAGPMAEGQVCYRIRAYIFKRDNDHAPELKSSTTCGPRQPRAKDIRTPDARLLPAQ